MEPGPLPQSTQRLASPEADWQHGDPHIIFWQAGASCCDSQWEKNYLRFESPEEEINKFTRRLRALGAGEWRKRARVAELFCGRGNGLVALTKMGFTNLAGVDLSPGLLQQYRGRAQLHVGDCRDLRFEDNSLDFVIIHGGLHHTENDLRTVLAQIHRVLAPGGRLAVVEPWLTPFLRIVHAACERPWLRQCSSKLDALARMIQGEKKVYFEWLSQPQAILDVLHEFFIPKKVETKWGKLTYVGEKQTCAQQCRLGTEQKKTP